MATFNPSTDYTTEQADIARRRKMAELLQQHAQDQELKGQMVGNIFVAPSITQGLAKALSAYGAKSQLDELDQKEKDLQSRMGQDLTSTVSDYSRIMQGAPASVVDDESGGHMQPAIAGDRNAALARLGQSQHPMAQQLYMAQMLKGMEPEKPVVVGRSLLDPRTGKQVGVDSTWQGEQQAAREEKARQAAEALQARREMAAQQEAMRRDLAAQSSADRRMIAGMVSARQEQKNVPKLPTSALKMQQEELDAIGTSGAINADLAAIDKQIADEKLSLGMVNNLASQAKNFVGASDESSRNFASFRATLEKLRNDSLRLNKGVQTEGDAQRAWNELVANANDPKVVRQRLGEIQKINERAANLRRMNVDSIRSNFGVDPMDAGERMNQPAAVGSGGSSVDSLLKKYGG